MWEGGDITHILLDNVKLGREAINPAGSRGAREVGGHPSGEHPVKVGVVVEEESSESHDVV
jgi:hypothetical protein